jgi:hypothetical protein
MSGVLRRALRTLGCAMGFHGGGIIGDRKPRRGLRSSRECLRCRTVWLSENGGPWRRFEPVRRNHGSTQ